RFDRMQGVAPKSVDADVRKVCAAFRQRPVVGLEDVPEVVIFNEEEARVGGMSLSAPLVRIGGIAEADAIPAPSIRLEEAAGRNGRGKGYVVVRSRIGVVDAVEAASHVGESEIADEALKDTVALQRGQGGVLRKDLAAVQKLEAPDLQGVRAIAAQSMEAH